MIDFTEINKLETLLKENNIPFEKQPLFDGIQICYPVSSGSYGSEKGLLEIMGLVSSDVNDDVEGWLTAQEVFERIERHYKGVKNDYQSISK